MSGTFKGFKELECWKKGRELRMRVSEICRTFPSEEKFLLKSQILDSSRSVTANIAEGYGRYTYTDTRHFFIQARGSLSETIEHLITAYDEKYIDEQTYNELEQLAETVFRLINGYINYLDKMRSQKTPIT